MISIYNNTELNSNEVLLPFHIALSGNSCYQKFRVINNQILSSEESYFNLMASMRKIRMKIPLVFTLEYFELKIKHLTSINNTPNACVLVYVFNDKEISLLFNIDETLSSDLIIRKNVTLDIYKEIEIFPTFLTLQSYPNTTLLPAEKYAEENELDDAILLSFNKKIARTIKGNIYFIKENQVIGIPKANGIINQAMDYEFQNYIRNISTFDLVFKDISGFETQTMDEVFIIEEGKGFHIVEKIRQKTFSHSLSEVIIREFYAYCVK